MADPTLAQSRTLNEFGTQASRKEYTLLWKLTWRWNVIRCWVRYMLGGANRGVAGLVDFVLGNHFFKAKQLRNELMTLGELIAELRPECALEIGTSQGGTLLFLTRLASPQATIVSVDLPGGRFGGGYSAKRKRFYQRFARRRQRLHLIQGDSHSSDVLALAKAALAEAPLDYLFIDGDHTYEGVKRDFELYSPLVRRGGIIAFHDIAEHPPEVGCEVDRFWDQIKSQYRHEEIIEDRRQGWAGIGMLYVD